MPKSAPAHARGALILPDSVRQTFTLLFFLPFSCPVLRILALDQPEPAQAALFLSPFPFYMKDVMLPDVLAALGDERSVNLQMVRTGFVVPVANHENAVSVRQPLQKMPIMPCASGSEENAIWIFCQNEEILFIDLLNFFYLNHI